MTFQEAIRQLLAVRNQVISERRSHLIQSRQHQEMLVSRTPIPKKPSGIFSRFLIKDVNRICSLRRIFDFKSDEAAKRVDAFDRALSSHDSALMRSLDAEATSRCDALDPEINRAVRERQRKLGLEQQHMDAVKRLGFESGTEYRLLSVSTARPLGNKREATLVGSIQVADLMYAKTTTDRGRSFDLYPWHDEMANFQGRAGWFWYSADGRFHFAPVIGTKPPFLVGTLTGQKGARLEELAESGIPMLRGDTGSE